MISKQRVVGLLSLMMKGIKGSDVCALSVAGLLPTKVPPPWIRYIQPSFRNSSSAFWTVIRLTVN